MLARERVCKKVGERFGGFQIILSGFEGYAGSERRLGSRERWWFVHLFGLDSCSSGNSSMLGKRRCPDLSREGF